MVILTGLKQYLFLVTISITVVFLLIWGWVKVQETVGIFHPTKIEGNPERVIPADYDWVTFDGEAGQLTGLWKTGDSGAPVILYFHGNAGNVLHRVEWLEATVPDSWNGFVFDYRGYGRSEGTPGEQGIYRDGASAIRYVQNRIQHNRVIFHARSMGVPVAARTMSVHCPKAIVFESGFPSASSMARTILPIPGISYLLSVNFDTVDAVRSLTEGCQSVNKLVIHGRRDRIVPPSQGQKLYDRLPGPKTIHFFDDVGHNDILMKDRTNYRTILDSFYRSHIN